MPLLALFKGKETPLALAGFAAAVALLYWFVWFFSRKMSHWKAVVRQFPRREIREERVSYDDCAGVVGNIALSYRGGFNVRLTADGMAVCPFFARHQPCFVPWSAVRRASVSDTSLLLTIECERPFQIFLPADILHWLHGKLAPQVFDQASSPIAAAKAALASGTAPRWMSAIADQTIRSAEKEIEKPSDR